MPINKDIRKKLIEGVYEGQYTVEKLSEPHYVETVINLRGGFYKGIKKNIQTVEMGSREWEIMTGINKNINIFSGAKEFQQIKDLQKVLLNENGSIRPYEAFLKDAEALNAVYDEVWLAPEYDLAIKQGMATRQWLNIQEHKKILPLLQYVTAGDDRVREDHAILDGIIKPVDDDFWDNFMPPNGWNCFERNTLIMTLNGWIPIQEIKKGEIILGGSGNYQLVEAVHVNPFNGNIIKVFSKRKSIKCTPNHRIATIKGWVEAERLKRGDIIIQVAKVSFFDKIINAIYNSYSLIRYVFMAIKR